MNRTSFLAWPEDIGPIFLTEEQIQQRINQLAAQISQDYAGKDLVVIGVLKGVLFFMAEHGASSRPVVVAEPVLDPFGFVLSVHDQPIAGDTGN